jgi:hypothetical protein
MAQPIFAETRSLEDAFFRKRDAQLIAEMRRRETTQTRKKALSEVSGITDETVLDQLVAHDIHAETLAAFSIVPIIEVAWADRKIQPEEHKILLRAIEEAGIPKDGVSYKLMEQWLTRPPKPKLMVLWQNYTRALMAELPPEAGERIRQTVLKHARAVADAAGGFLGIGRVSSQEEKILRTLEAAFLPPGK